MEKDQPAPEEGATKTTPAPNEGAKQTTSPAASGKKNNNLIIIIIVIVLVLGAGGYIFNHFILAKVAEKTTEKALEKMTGSDIDLNKGGATVKNDQGSVSTGSKAKWPSDIPSTVPEFTYGKIVSSMSSNTGQYKGWSATFSDIDSDAADKYAAALVAKGWTKKDSIDMGTVKNMSYTLDNMTVNATIDGTQKSTGASITISYNH